MKTKILNLILIFSFFAFFASLSTVLAAVSPGCLDNSANNQLIYNSTTCKLERANAAAAQPTGSKAGSNNGATVQGSQCNDPFSSAYTSQGCVQLRLGITDLKAGQILIARDPNSLFVVAAQIFIWVVIVASVFRIAWKGIQIGGAGDDADKRKELFVAIIWTLVGLVVALGALAITMAVANFAFGKTFNDQIIDCTNLPPTAELSLVNKCNEVINGAGGGNGGGLIPTP